MSYRLFRLAANGFSGCSISSSEFDSISSRWQRPSRLPQPPLCRLSRSLLLLLLFPMLRSNCRISSTLVARASNSLLETGSPPGRGRSLFGSFAIEPRQTCSDTNWRSKKINRGILTFTLKSLSGIHQKMRESLKTVFNIWNTKVRVRQRLRCVFILLETCMINYTYWMPFKSQRTILMTFSSSLCTYQFVF